MHADPSTNPVAGFAPLAPLLARIEPDRLAKIASAISDTDTVKLIDAFRSAFTERRRAAAYLIAEALSERGIPPCFRHDHRSRTDYSDEQKSDLLTFDLRWLRRWYPEHQSIVTFSRSKGIFYGSDQTFFHEIEFASYRGTRSAWKIVKSLKTTDEQQLECFWLHSAPIAKRVAATLAIRDSVFSALKRGLQTVLRTKAYTADDASKTITRRHRIWIARQFTANGSPTKVAKKFTQLTEEPITIQVVARQLSIIDKVLKESKREAE